MRKVLGIRLIIVYLGALGVLLSGPLLGQNDATPPSENTQSPRSAPKNSAPGSRSVPPPPPNGSPAGNSAVTPTGESMSVPPPNASTPAATPPPATQPPPIPEPEPKQTAPAKPRKEVAADNVPAGQELVNIDFPEPTEIKDIIRAVALWTGKNVILGKGVSGKVQMISPRKVTKEEAYQAFLSALNVLGLTTVETGKVIKILQVRSAVRGNLQIFQGSSWAPQTDKMITQIVPLKYIDAKAIQSTLSRIVSTNSMIAYQPTNTLIISDTGFKVRRILAIIELLDVQGQQPQVALVPIKYADAKSVAQKVQEIFQASSKSGKKADGSYGGYKISVDERSNSVVIFGPPRTISDVKALVKKFDFPLDDPNNQAAIRVRFLDYADAKKLAATLSSLAQGGSSSRSRSLGRSTFSAPPAPGVPGTPNAGGGSSSSSDSAVADLGDNVKITADESSNSLLITGSRAAYNAVNTLIRKLDRRRAQVYVESDILDIKLGNGFNFGTSIFAGAGKATGTKTAFGWQGSKIGTIIEAQRNPDSDSALKAAIGAFGGSDFTIGVLSGAKVNVPGIGEVSPGALINLIKRDSNSRVLSSPHLLTSNNEKAKILVGQKIFYKSAQQSSLPGIGAVEKVEKEDADLSLEIKPNVSQQANYVTLDLKLEANEGALNQFGVPDINKRQTQQIVTVKNSQTAVISGLVKIREGESFQKIPFLGDIPILGWLFRNSSLEKETTNLVIFITPHIVYGANDLAAIYDAKIKERDEIMARAFDVDPGNPFMAKLPGIEDGKYHPDDADKLDQESQQQMLKEIREDMGYPSETPKMDNTPKDTGAEDKEEAAPTGEATPVPMMPGGFEDGGDVGGGDAGGDAGGAPPPPPPPPPTGGDDGGGGE